MDTGSQKWIFTRTVRFVGIARIVIHDGKGFILSKKGKGFFVTLNKKNIEFKGNTALDYLNSHKIIEFNLCKYTTEKCQEALKTCSIEGENPNGQKEHDTQKSEIPEPIPTAPSPFTEPVVSSLTIDETPRQPVFQSKEILVVDHSTVPQSMMLEESDIKMIS